MNGRGDRHVVLISLSWHTSAVWLRQPQCNAGTPHEQFMLHMCAAGSKLAPSGPCEASCCFHGALRMNWCSHHPDRMVVLCCATLRCASCVRCALLLVTRPVPPSPTVTQAVSVSVQCRIVCSSMIKLCHAVMCVLCCAVSRGRGRSHASWRASS